LNGAKRLAHLDSEGKIPLLLLGRDQHFSMAIEAKLQLEGGE
jgi:hypothetical protein